MMDKLLSMQVFVEAVERGSLTASAERLGLSRAKASRHLAELEQWLGMRLLHRSTRSLSITHHGEQILAECYKMLSIRDNMLMLKGEDDSVPRGKLRITCSQSFSDSYLIHVINRYLQQYPLVEIEMLVVEEALNLVDERIDLAIRITKHLEPGIIAKQLGYCRSVICASPEYLKRYGRPKHPSELLDHVCLTHAQFATHSWRFLINNEEIKVPVKGRITTNETNVLKQSALAGIGIAFVPLYLVRNEIQQNRLEVLLADYALDTANIYAIFRSRLHITAAQRSLLDYLTASFKADTFWQ